MLKELVKGAAALTVNVAGAVVHEAAEKVRKLAEPHRQSEVATEVTQESPVRAASEMPLETDAHPLPHSVPPTVAQALEQPTEGPQPKAKRGQKHHHRH